MSAATTCNLYAYAPHLRAETFDVRDHYGTTGEWFGGECARQKSQRYRVCVCVCGVLRESRSRSTPSDAADTVTRRGVLQHIRRTHARAPSTTALDRRPETFLRYSRNGSTAARRRAYPRRDDVVRDRGPPELPPPPPPPVGHAAPLTDGRVFCYCYCGVRAIASWVRGRRDRSPAVPARARGGEGERSAVADAAGRVGCAPFKVWRAKGGRRLRREGT